MNTDNRIRSSCNRWLKLSRILASLERCVEASSRLDARTSTKWVGSEHQKLIKLNRDIAFLEGLIDHQLDVLTCERLDAELARKVAACAA